MRSAAPALLLAALLAAGCVTRTVERPAPLAADAPNWLDMTLECDRARVVVPERLREEFERPSETPGRHNSIAVGNVVVSTREGNPEIEIRGDDFSVIAEGGVILRRASGGRSVEEGPYHTVILRNGNLLRR